MTRSEDLVVRRERWTVVAILALLQVIALVAGGYVITHDVVRTPAPNAPAEPTPPPIVAAGPVLAVAGDGALPAKGTLTTQLRDAMGGTALGGNVAGVVQDVRTGRVLFDDRAAVPMTPASTTKIVTAVAVLASVGADATLATRVVAGPSRNGIILVGGGDPTVVVGPRAGHGTGRPADAYPRPTSLATLASRTAEALRKAKITKVDLSYDTSLFTGPRTAPGWKPTYIPEGSVAPVAALTMDEGRTPDRARLADPPRATAAAFATLLRGYGIEVTGAVRPVTAPPKAREFARVESAPVYALVERMLTRSDNDLAEALARQVAIKERQPSTFAGQVKAVQRVLARLGVPDGIEIYDGSGLSTKNRITPTALVRLLAIAAAPGHPELSSLISGLPVAGFTGTLHDRYGRPDATAGAGIVRAKTGTLNGVNTLAGVTRTSTGRLVAFAFMADQVVDPFAATAALDRMAAVVSRS